jgi:hypothetical protein
MSETVYLATLEEELILVKKVSKINNHIRVIILSPEEESYIVGFIGELSIAEINKSASFFTKIVKSEYLGFEDDMHEHSVDFEVLSNSHLID